MNETVDSVENFNFWLLEVLPEKLEQLADATEVSPAGMTLPEWERKLREIASLLREADVETCRKYADLLHKEELSESERKEVETYCDLCKTKAFHELNHYFWYLNC